MKVEYINPFISSTVNVFETMVNTRPQPGRPSLQMDPTGGPHFISGVIGLSGDVSGSVVVSFPKKLALKLVSSMLGTEIKIIDDAVSDAVGELTNIIAGRAKEQLKGYNVSIALPNVIVGERHTVRRPSGVPCVTIPFVTEWGDFHVDVTMKETKPVAGADASGGSVSAAGGV